MLNDMSTVQLFISHSESDEPLVRPLAAWLQFGLGLDDDSVRCTVVSNMDVGAIPAEALRKDLNSSKAVIGLLTANSLASSWVQLELGAGWLRERLHPIRGPGISVSDLPSPLSDFTTVGYCEKDQMHSLLTQLADSLDTSVNPNSREVLEDIAQGAEDMLVADMVRWFSLPPVLSAWRIKENVNANYEFKLSSLCSELGLLRKEALSCVSKLGVLTRDPDRLPSWGRDLWSVSKNAVNYLLTDGFNLAENGLDVPPGILSDRLNTDMRRALLCKTHHRAELVQKWFTQAQDWIRENPPSTQRVHSLSGHKSR